MRCRSGCFLVLVCFTFFLLACALTIAPAPPPTPILPVTVSTPAATSAPPIFPLLGEVVTPSPEAASPADTGWQSLQSGLEQRTINRFDVDGRQRESLYMLRLEPEHFHFRIAYHPRQAQNLRDWQVETSALLVVNGGYFTEELVATGLTVVQGEPSGVSYGDFAGMLAITAAGPEVRWLREKPYDPAEPLQYALQSFPVLVKPGGEAGFPDEDGIQSRRTVVGQDRDGRMLFILAPWGSFTLYELSNYLATSDLDLQIALNLDGGTSSGLLLVEPPVEIPAFVPLPVVITVHPR